MIFQLSLAVLPLGAEVAQISVTLGVVFENEAVVEAEVLALSEANKL